MSGYQQALEAAGAKVLQFEQFGSYQGEWFALVEFNGERGWVNGWYGSCSGCDAFEGEFGWSDDEGCEAHRYRRVAECANCDAAKADWHRRLVDFGATYLGTLLTQEQAEAHAGRDLEWDADAVGMLAFVKEHGGAV